MVSCRSSLLTLANPNPWCLSFSGWASVRADRRKRRRRGECRCDLVKKSACEQTVLWRTTHCTNLNFRYYTIHLELPSIKNTYVSKNWSSRTDWYEAMVLFGMIIEYDWYQWTVLWILIVCGFPCPKNRPDLLLLLRRPRAKEGILEVDKAVDKAATKEVMGAAHSPGAPYRWCNNQNQGIWPARTCKKVISAATILMQIVENSWFQW